MQTKMVRTRCCNAKWVVLAVVLGLLVFVWSSTIVVPAIRGRSIDKFATHLEKDWWRNQAAAQRGLGLANGLAQTPQMGWNSWNHFNCFIDEDLIIETAEALISTGLAAVGYKYVNIDDCWAELKRDSEGNLVPRAATFPSGIRALADHVHELGLKLGIYSDAGEYTCQKQPGSFGYEEKDAAAFASWEIDYLKYDNCYNDDSLPEVRYPPMRDALNRTGRPIFFSMCEWGVDNPALWAGAVGNSWRTTEDIKDKWSSMVDIIDENDVWADYAGPGGWNDPDMLEVGNGGMSMSEYRTHFSLWALAKAPLLIGCDVRDISPEVLSILANEEVIAVNQDSLGVQGRKVATSRWWWEWWKRPEVWAGPLSGGRTAVILWNRAVKAGNVSLKWSDIGFGTELSFEVRDLWAHKTWEGNVKEGIEVHLCGHCSEMFILTPLDAV